MITRRRFTRGSALIPVLITICMSSVPGLALGQREPTIGQVAAQLGRLKSEMSRRGQFETSAEYETRRGRLQRDVESLLGKTYPGACVVSFGTYDADNETFPVRLAGEAIDEQLNLKVPREEARVLHETGQIARASCTGRFWLEEDGKTYLAGVSNVIIAGKTYRTDAAKVGIAVARQIRLYDHPDFRNASSVTFSPGDTLLAVRMSETGSVILWNLVNGASLAAAPQINSVGKPVFSPDGRFVATVARSPSGFGDPAAGELRLFALEGTRQAASVPESLAVTALAFSPDGASLAIGTRSYVRFWNMQSRTGIRRVESDSRVNALAFSRTGTTLAVGNRAVQLLDLSGGGGSRTLGDRDGDAVAVALSHDGRLAAAAFQEERRMTTVRATVVVWSAESGQELVTLDGSNISEVQEIVFSPDGRLIAAAGENRCCHFVKVWDATNGAELRSFEAQATFGIGGDSVAFSADGRWLATVLFGHLQLREIVLMR